jgi:hypothetical protein
MLAPTGCSEYLPGMSRSASPISPAHRRVVDVIYATLGGANAHLRQSISSTCVDHEMRDSVDTPPLQGLTL